MAYATLVAASSGYVAAGFGLAGSLIGGLIAGWVSFGVARQARQAAEASWIRDNRRELYDRFLTNAQQLLIDCVEYMNSPATNRDTLAVQSAYTDFFNAYSVIQTVAAPPVVAAARIQAYRLMELRQELNSNGNLGAENFGAVAALVRDARHDTIDAMRGDLGLAGAARPAEGFNPFIGTPFAADYTSRRSARRDRTTDT